MEHHIGWRSIVVGLVFSTGLVGCSGKRGLQERDAEIANLRQQVGTMRGEVGQLESDYAAAVARAERLEAELAELADRERLQLDQLEKMTVLRLPERMLFLSGSAELTDEGVQLMSRLGRVLAGYPEQDIRVEGHTDDKPIRGTLSARFATNWELSTARATTVLRRLVQKHNLSPDRLVAVGYGEHRPMYSNDTSDGRARNRRVEFHIAKPAPVRDMEAG